MRKPTQILYVHGGMTFSKKKDYLRFLRTRDVSIERKVRWNDAYLREQLGSDFHVIKPRMPCQDYAQYKEWKIFFERFFDTLEDDVILIGTSLGGIFLAKYLSENMFPKKIRSVYLIAPPFDDTLPTETLSGGFELGENLSKITKQCSDVKLLFSVDDDIVPVSQAEKYKEKLPDAQYILYESKNGHFLVEEFPEIIEMVKGNN
jgi:uncharacterized protein